jgi:hypothetical protein
MPVEIIVSTRQLPVKDLLNAVCDELDQLEALYGTKTRKIPDQVRKAIRCTHSAICTRESCLGLDQALHP